ncbi:hypothetical protein MHYP_G00075210 [Metynnis hypsauchen]
MNILCQSGASCLAHVTDTLRTGLINQVLCLKGIGVNALSHSALHAAAFSFPFPPFLTTSNPAPPTPPPSLAFSCCLCSSLASPSLPLPLLPPYLKCRIAVSKWGAFTTQTDSEPASPRVGVLKERVFRGNTLRCLNTAAEQGTLGGHILSSFPL